MQQIASDINKMKRWSLVLPLRSCRTKDVQVIACKESAEVGSLPQIRRLTTTLRVKSIKMELQYGSAMEVPSPSGTRRVPSCGSMENVRFPCPPRDTLDSCPLL